MALVNPPGLFSEGNVRLNPLPYVNIAIQREQRKQAKNEALDRYYQTLPSTINDKNVRDQEIEGLNEYKKKIFEYGVTNKEALRKGDGAAILGLDKLFREANMYAQESRNRTATAEKLAKLRGNPKYDYIFKDPTIIDKIDAHERPIGTEGAQGINFDQITLPPPPFDPVKHVSGIPVKPNPAPPTYQEIPGDKFNRLEITGKQFSPEDLNAVHVYAQTQLDNNPSFEKQIKEHVQTNPKIAAQMADVFQRNYGHPIETDDDLAAAYTLSMMDLKPTQKVVANRERIADDKEAKWIKHNKITNQQKKERIQLNNSGRVYTIENVPLSVRNNSYTEPSVYGDYQVSDATKLSEGQMEDIFGKKGGKFGERPYKPIETNGKKLIKVLPEGLEVRDADGNPVIIKDNDIIVNTNKRTVSLEKPVGTGKAKIRTTTPADKVGKYNGL